MKRNIFSTSGMIIFPNGTNKTKAIAQVTVNDEFVINSIRVFEGANGPYALMPSKLVDGEYNQLVFPITAETRQDILDTVIRTYNNMVASGMERLPRELIAPFENPQPAPREASNIFVTLDKHNGKVKAVGKAVINNTLVITDVRVYSYTDENGEEKLGVGYPHYKTADGEYKSIIYLSDPAFREKFNAEVMSKYQKLLETEFLGLTFSELRKFGELEKVHVSSTDFAKKLAAALDEVGVPFSAALNSNSALYVLKEDADIAAEVRKSLTKKLISSAA